MSERWADIEGFPNYQISDQGRVMNSQRGYEKYPTVLADGTLVMRLSHNARNTTHLVHRLVGRAFLQDFNETSRIVFRDGNRSNCRVDNLEMGGLRPGPPKKR